MMHTQLLSLGGGGDGGVDAVTLHRTKEKPPEDSAAFQPRIIQLEGQVELQPDISSVRFPPDPPDPPPHPYVSPPLR